MFTCCAAAPEQQGERKALTIKSTLWPDFVCGLPRMDGKFVAVTGCTSGTGFVLAKACAEKGATVIMLNRISARSEAAEEDIKAAVPGAKVTTVACDLQSFDSVRAAAVTLNKQYAQTGIDVLCNNAGVIGDKDEATKDGYGLCMQTNHLSHFLLTCECWSLLEKAQSLRGDARVVNHSSLMRKGDPLDKTHLGKNGGNLGCDAWKCYHHSKLANLVFTLAIRDRAARAGSQVKALVAEPGAAGTNVLGSSPIGGWFMDMVQGQLSQSAEDGAIALTICCCQPDVQSGQFYAVDGLKGYPKLMPAEPEETLADPASRDMLWQESEVAVGSIFNLSTDKSPSRKGVACGC